MIPKPGPALTPMLATLVLLGGCATWTPPSTHHALTATAEGVEACRERLAATGHGRGGGLDWADITLATWNAQKFRDPGAAGDLAAIAAHADLVLIQEAVLPGRAVAGSHAPRFRSFAPGYETRRFLTGVMTLSAIEPLARCSLVSLEPLLRSPKATSVTEYALTGTDKTLVVVNVHAVNFTLGTRRFREQFEQVAAVLRAHAGPVIMSGDFNTWRRGRLRIVEGIAGELGLAPVRFDDDRRTTRFGFALDHIYARGFEHRDASTRDVQTSDHNPMRVRLARSEQ